MVLGLQTLKRELNYNASRFAQMLGEHGGVGAAKRLLDSEGYSEGFTTLWEKGRLEMSVEFFVLLPWYEQLFTSAERQRAFARLEAYEFHVAAALERARRVAPQWWDDAPGRRSEKDPHHPAHEGT